MTHIYTTPPQPATHYTNDTFDPPIIGGFDADTLIYTDCCGTARAAADCTVQCYYDGLRVWCADGRGCKDPVFIAEKRARVFANRSAGQQARRARERGAQL